MDRGLLLKHLSDIDLLSQFLFSFLNGGNFFDINIILYSITSIYYKIILGLNIWNLLSFSDEKFSIHVHKSLAFWSDIFYCSLKITRLEKCLRNFGNFDSEKIIYLDFFKFSNKVSLYFKKSIKLKMEKKSFKTLNLNPFPSIISNKKLLPLIMNPNEISKKLKTKGSKAIHSPFKFSKLNVHLY